MILLAIDPGNTESAYVLYEVETRTPFDFKTDLPNDQMLDFIEGCKADRIVIEMIASYGMPVGAEVFETCVTIGRFAERWEFSHATDALMMYRSAVKLHLCRSSRAKDPNVRQALLDRFGPGRELAIGKKATPGPLYGLTGDCWAALGVAVTAAETDPPTN